VNAAAPRRRWGSRRSQHDAEIWRLALPAFGALAAEPLYVLVDTAIVGHLGTDPLAGLAIAGIVLTAAYGLCNFLAYSTTAAVARRVGAKQWRAAAEQGIDGLWLASGIGVAMAVVGIALAPVIVDVMGASGTVRPDALTYLRISLFGAPAMLVMLAGNGYLRGVQDTRSTLVIAVAANAANLALDLLLIYGLDLGIAGSAWGTVIAQWGAAAVFVVIVVGRAHAVSAAPWPRAAGVRTAALVGSQLAVRTAALLATLLLATAIASRLGDADVAAHQIAFQLWTLLALLLDGIAIAGQALTGKHLGADDPVEARGVGRRMVEWGVVVGLLLGAVLAIARPWLVPLFTDDAAVQALAIDVLWIVALLQPANAVVFVLDGVLIGAGDARYLALAMALATVVFVPLGLAVLALDASLLWLWATLGVWVAARLVGNAARFAGHRWEVSGAVR
jgi:putative MATE family efflux protein